MLAGAAVEMTNFSTSQLPEQLLKSLDIGGDKKELLARFLFYLRTELIGLDHFKDGIFYANDMDQLGLLRGLGGQMASLAGRLDALSSMEAALLAERHLTTKDQQALTDYLTEMRLRWEGLMLPLLRKKTGDITSAKLKQVFVPLKLRDIKREEEAQKNLSRKRKAEEISAEENLPVEIGELLNRHERFILIGPPGCGKTTLLNRLALAFVEGRAANELGWQGKALLPFFLRLRNFGVFIRERRADFPGPSSGALVAYLENQLRVGDRILLTADFLDRRLDEGSCLVLMDGLDEVADMRNDVAGHVDAFIERYGKRGNHFGMASRPRGYETVEMKLRRCNLAVAEVNALDLRGIGELVGNLLLLIEIDRQLRAADQKNLTRAIEASEELVRIAGTPLFCSALVQVYKYQGARLPSRRVDVFDEIVDLLLGYWRAQQRHLSQAEQLAIEDGTGRQYREVKDAVAVKQRRLSYLADHMQRTRQAEISKEEAQNVLVKFLQERERVQDEEIARVWAENFLISSHELSGLLVERDPGIYSFLHKGFMEYLAAGALVNQSKTFVETVLGFLTDEWWEQVILLGGAHPKLAEDVRIELIEEILKQAESFLDGTEEHLRHLVMAGRLARDMAEYLPGMEHELVESTLLVAAKDADKKPSFRCEVADTLDELGYQPADISTFMAVPTGEKQGFLMAKYPVTNAQYARFLTPENFANKEYWSDFPMFDESSQTMAPKTWGEKAWMWLQDQLSKPENAMNGGVLAPREWGDARFGVGRANAPVVRISWYEANAYARWLLDHWDEHEESQYLAKPKVLRLPTRAEWVQAASGADPKERFPWDAVGKSDTTQAEDDATVKEVLRHANVAQSGIRRTTPVWLYPQGASKPFGLMDLGGNVWEWQANYRSGTSGSLWLSGGSWSSKWNFARVSDRSYDSPNDGYFNRGFRMLALPS